MAAIGRTKPLYPTDGPGDGRTWNEYFRAAKAVGQSTEEDEEPEPEVEVLEAGHDVDPAALSARSKPAQVAKRLIARGWEVRARQSRVRVPAVLYKSDGDDHQKGDVRYPEFDLETTCLLGVKRAAGKMLAVEATWTSKEGFVMAKTYDPFLGLEYRVGYTKGRKPNSIEVEEGMTAPIGLEQWLRMMAPTEAERKKREKEAA